MGRHYRSGSFYRSATTRRASNGSCPAWMWEISKSPSGVLSAIQTTVIVVSFLAFLWCLWKLPQEHNEYPDGFLQCPDLSYKVWDYRNVTVKCVTCPECPPGHEPTPPCASNISTETPIGCQICRPQTYSEEHDSGRCKPCQRCGLRETISPCTRSKSTQCGPCPRWHYQAEFTLNSCKECSTCCGGRRYAELACIYLKHCRRKICTQTAETTNHIHRFEGVTRAEYQRKNENQVANQMPLIMPHINKSLKRFKRENYRTWQKANINPGVTVLADKLTTRFEAVDLNPLTKPTTSGDYEEITRLSSTKSKLEEASFDNAPKNNNMEQKMALTSSYFGDVKQLLSILVALVGFGVLLLVFVATVVTCICWKRIQWRQIKGNVCCIKLYVGDSEEYLPVLSYSTTHLDNDHLSGNMASSSSWETNAETDLLERIPLTEMPLDLRDSLAIKLDVRREGERRLRGWQKVGNIFHIEGDILYFLENEYERPGGSPTIELLKILETRGKNVLELVNALKSPEVNYPDIALLIKRSMEAQSH